MFLVLCEETKNEDRKKKKILSILIDKEIKRFIERKNQISLPQGPRL